MIDNEVVVKYMSNAFVKIKKYIWAMVQTWLLPTDKWIFTYGQCINNRKIAVLWTFKYEKRTFSNEFWP